MIELDCDICLFCLTRSNRQNICIAINPGNTDFRKKLFDPDCQGARPACEIEYVLPGLEIRLLDKR